MNSVCTLACIVLHPRSRAGTTNTAMLWPQAAPIYLLRAPSWLRLGLWPPSFGLALQGEPLRPARLQTWTSNVPKIMAPSIVCFGYKGHDFGYFGGPGRSALQFAWRENNSELRQISVPTSKQTPVPQSIPTPPFQISCCGLVLHVVMKPRKARRSAQCRSRGQHGTGRTHWCS